MEFKKRSALEPCSMKMLGWNMWPEEVALALAHSGFLMGSQLDVVIIIVYYKVHFPI